MERTANILNATRHEHRLHSTASPWRVAAHRSPVRVRTLPRIRSRVALFPFSQFSKTFDSALHAARLDRFPRDARLRRSRAGGSSAQLVERMGLCTGRLGAVSAGGAVAAAESRSRHCANHSSARRLSRSGRWTFHLRNRRSFRGSVLSHVHSRLGPEPATSSTRGDSRKRNQSGYCISFRRRLDSAPELERKFRGVFLRW